MVICGGPLFNENVLAWVKEIGGCSDAADFEGLKSVGPALAWRGYL
jgi:hypothetical protein